MDAVIERDRQETGAVNDLPWYQEIKGMLDGTSALRKLPRVPPYTDCPFEEWPVYALGNDKLAQELVFWSLAHYCRWNVEMEGNRRATLCTKHGDIVAAVFPERWEYANYYFMDILVDAKTWPELGQDVKFTSRGLAPHQTARYFAMVINHVGRAIAQMLDARVDAQPVLQKCIECQCDF